jgi:hypothetical protein
MEEVRNKCNGHSRDEAERNGTHDTDESLTPMESPPLVNILYDNNATAISEANSGRGEDELPDAPLVYDQECTNEGKIYVPHKYDVLLGRGRPLQNHPGNLRFHKIINRARASYVNSRKEGKAGIAKEVLDEIRTSKKKGESNSNQPPVGDGEGDGVNSPSSVGEPGRFLKKIGDANASGEDVYWEEVPREVAIEKISHALRGRPRSETSNRSDGSGGGKGNRNNGAGTGQSGIASGRPKSYIDNTTRSGKSKRKGPPSPPTDDTPPNVVAGTNISGFTGGESGEKSLQRSNITDAILTTSANIPNRMLTVPKGSSMSALSTSNNNEPTTVNTNADNGNNISAPTASAPLDNQLQAMLTAWQLQQFQVAMHFQQQNTQQVEQQQLFQQFMQQQQISATEGGGSLTAAALGHNHQPPLNNGVVGQLSTMQQQLQLLIQQQEAQRLLQQQAQQLQPQQVQYILQQSHIQPQQPHQQQRQVQSTIQQSQQTQAQQQLQQYLQLQQQVELLAHGQQEGEGGVNLPEQGKTQQSQQQQSQMHPLSYQQQQNQLTTASNATGGGATMDPNFVNAAAAIISASQYASENGSANAAANNQNIRDALLFGASSILAAQQPQTATNQTTQTTQNPQPVASQTGSGQIVGVHSSQLQLQQSLEFLLTALYPQQQTNLNSSSLTTPQQHPQPPPGNQPPPNNW